MFARQIDEIRADRALTLYGAALAAANITTFVQWKFRLGVPLMIGRGADTLCWPFWENCHAAQLPVSALNYGLWGFLLLSAIAAYWFLTGKVARGYWTLVLVNAIRVFVMIQDYRLKGNQHYMLNWVLLAFLFLPWKRELVHHAIVSLYFWAGALKLDWDWLSGAALYGQDQLWFPAALVPAGCWYVVILEMVLIWGLYARRAWIFYGVLAQLVFFHLTSWPVVGFWYPTLMFCLLSILPLSRLRHPPAAWVRAPWRVHGQPRWAYAGFMAAFGVFQMVPHAFPGDTAVSGEGRMFALHMFDALVECDARIAYRLPGGATRDDPLEQARRLPHRSRCDPVIYFDIAKNRCAETGGAADLDVSLRARRNSDAEYRPVIDVKGFCQANPSYDVWRHNSWIHVQ
jgi:hypothetical protein